MCKAKYILFVITFCCAFFSTNAQLTTIHNFVKNQQISFPDSVLGWHEETNLKLNLNQAAYKNWVLNKNSNLALTIRLVERFYFKKPIFIWDNRILLTYGMTKLEEEPVRKANDLIEYNSIVGKRLTKKYILSYIFNLKTQFTNGYDFSRDPNGEYRISGFLAPANIKTGLGVMWRDSNHFYINVAPAAMRLIYIKGKVYKYNKSTETFEGSDQVTVYNVEPNKHIDFIFGFYGATYFRFNLAKNIQVENILALFSNYLDKPQNIDLDYTMNMTFKINKLLSSQLLFRARYDDDEFKAFQIKEHFGVGLNLDL